MPRTARIVIPDAPHHVTQRGNGRQASGFFVNDDRRAYLGILAEETVAANVTAGNVGQAMPQSFPNDLISVTGFEPSPEAWQALFRQADDPRAISTLHRATQTGQPLAGDSAMSKFEKRVGRRLRALPPSERQPMSIPAKPTFHRPPSAFAGRVPAGAVVDLRSGGGQGSGQGPGFHLPASSIASCCGS